MKKWLWISGSILLTGILIVGIFGFMRASSSATEIAAESSEVALSNPKLWQEKEAPAYTPVKRDGAGLWRSVRIPPVSAVERLLQQTGQLSLDASPAEQAQAVQAWYQRASKDAYYGPDPRAYQQLLEREQQLLNAEDSQFSVQEETFPTPPKAVLGVVVEFAPPSGSEVFTRTYPVDPNDPSLGCTDIADSFSSLNVGDDPPPGPSDNFSFYNFGGFTTEDYESAFFDTGPDAGYGVISTTAGTFDLSGYSLNNYLLEMSGGVYTTTGSFLTVPVTVPHSHEYYGHAVYSEDIDGNCTSPTFSDANYQDYVPDIVDAIIAQYGDSVDWSQYDVDGDHIIDAFVTVHAGYAFQNGGGEDRLSTSSSSLFPGKMQIGGTTTVDTSDDYYVQGFNVDPEQLDVGAIQEEFEHQFGLPDLYVTDANNSNAWWAAHSSGVWGGPLGATRPVGHNLWQDWVLGWRDPLVIDYDDPELLLGKKEVTIGRARYTPEETEEGVIVRLPDEGVLIENLAGDGTGWWSNSGDLMDNFVYRDFDLVTATAPVTFSFDAYWDIEEDWDYGYLEVSTDGGTTWTSLPDIDGILRDTNPNGNNLGWGLTGAGSGALRFDLSAYAGSTVGVRFRYNTDPAVSNPGWWVDNLLLEDAGGVLYANDLDADFSDWTNEGWLVTPLDQVNERYYLVEWRDNNGFDQSLDDPYQVIYDSPTEPPPEVLVDRLAATTPGMLMAYRNTGQGFDYTLLDSLGDDPSYGPKFGHLVVDSHFEPKRFDTLLPDFFDGYVGPNISGRVLPGDATFGLEQTREWATRLPDNYDTSSTTIVETKTWSSEPPVMEFHDSYGYYPGFFYPGTGTTVYFHDSDGSLALPAKGPYTTRITDLDGNLLYDLYGVPIGTAGLGSGNPGDNNVQYGLHVEVVAGSEQAGMIHIWNDLFQVKSSVVTDLSHALPSTGTVTFTVDENIGGLIADPYIIIELPDNLEYVDGSNFGGLVPVEGATFATAADALAHVKSVGYSALAGRTAVAQDVHYLVWTGDDIGTKLGTPPFGFDASRTGLGNLDFAVTYFKEGTDEFQSEVLAPELQGSHIALPVVFK
jgi:immune inhibitor A